MPKCSAFSICRFKNPTELFFLCVHLNLWPRTAYSSSPDLSYCLCSGCIDDAHRVCYKWTELTDGAHHSCLPRWPVFNAYGQTNLWVKLIFLVLWPCAFHCVDHTALHQCTLFVLIERLSLCGSHYVTSVLPDCANSGIWGSLTWLLAWCRASLTDDCGICLFQKESRISHFAKCRAWFGGHLGCISLKKKYPRYMMGRTGKHLHERFGEAKTGNCILPSRVAFVRENRG